MIVADRRTAFVFHKIPLHETTIDNILAGEGQGEGEPRLFS